MASVLLLSCSESQLLQTPSFSPPEPTVAAPFDTHDVQTPLPIFEPTYNGPDFYTNKNLWDAEVGRQYLVLEPSLFFYPGEDESLPNILIIGDSISIGYTLALREKFRGRANTFRVPGNARSSSYTNYFLRLWLGISKKWDLILVNHGLHEAGLISGEPRNSVEYYAQSLREEFRILRETGARLVFVTTTPLPPENLDRTPIEAYNEVAIAEAEAAGIDVIDLYSYILDHHILHLSPNDVHFGEDARRLIAEFIYNSL